MTLTLKNLEDAADELYGHGDSIEVLVATTDTLIDEIEKRLIEHSFHGSHCIDDMCEDEGHGFDAVGVEDIRRILREFKSS